jgi:hypothetical protein
MEEELVKEGEESEPVLEAVEFEPPLTGIAAPAVQVKLNASVWPTVGEGKDDQGRPLSKDGSFYWDSKRWMPVVAKSEVQAALETDAQDTEEASAS